LRNERVEEAVASICDQGCRYVNAILRDDKLRRACGELQVLGADERARVLDELAAVMSVYDVAGSCES
jgi:hypothetical protein